MKDFKREYDHMLEELDKIAIASEDELQRAEQSYYLTQQTLQEVNDYIVSHKFHSKEEEIDFFKNVKPLFQKELIYYTEVFHIEATLPVAGKEAKEQHYRKEMDRVNGMFKRNHFLYLYYRMGKTDLDEVYFLREGSRNHPLPECSLEIDSRCSTVYSFKIAKLQAYERLNTYLQQCLAKLEHPEQLIVAGEKKKNRILWTDSKAALIELAYAIHARGSVNNGRGDVKQVVEDLERLFNVQLGNFYRTFQSMRIRKKNRTSYLDNLKESLEKKMDDSDLNYS